MANYLPCIQSRVKKIFAESIAYAVGDGILEDVMNKKLVTQNGNPARIWDILHTTLKKKLINTSLVANPTKRGAWAILPVLDLETHVLFCCMREANFTLLTKRPAYKARRHYEYALNYAFNSDLPTLQSNLFGNEVMDYEKSLVFDTIKRITSDMGVQNGIIERHALLLFKSLNGQMVSLRCCVVNSEFEIIQQEDWSQFIPTFESIIVETAVPPETPISEKKAEIPLKSKAQQLAASREIVKLRSTEENGEIDE